MSDLLLAGLLVKGCDPLQSTRKVGLDRPIGELTHEELAGYIAPFRETALRWRTPAAIVHDGLPDAFVAAQQTERLSFPCCPAGTDHTNYERRFAAFRDLLAARPDIDRVWIVDVNDVVFLIDPWAWWDSLPLSSEAILVNEEHVAYRDNPWFTDAFPHLPENYRRNILHQHGTLRAVNCGAWAARRDVALAVLSVMCQECDRLRDYLASHPPPFRIMLDMYAFAYVLFTHFWEQVVTFRQDGRTPGVFVRSAVSPLVHDRPEALRTLGLPD